MRKRPTMRLRSSSCSNESFMPRAFAPPQPKQGFSGFGSSFMALLGSGDQFAPHHGYCLAGNENAIARATGADETAARRSLVANQVITSQAFLPVGAQTAVRRTGDRVFVDACTGSKKTRNII